MSDQCMNCTVRGDLKECLSTDCSQHESWMTQEVMKQLKASQDEASINESALADWHKFGDYLYKLFGQTKYLEMCKEAKLLDELNISLSQASETEGEG